MSTIHRSPSVLQYLWGTVVLTIAVLFIALMVVVAVVSGLLLRLLLPWSPHTAKWITWPFSWGFRYLILPLAGISLSIDLGHYRRPAAGVPVISADIHPESLGMLLHSVIKAKLFGMQFRQVGKIELLTGRDPIERMLGIGMRMMNCLAAIDRADPDGAVRVLREHAVTEPHVAICTMLEGTRPRVGGIEAGRRYLREEGFSQLADGLLYTSCPRVRGLYELRRALPNAAVISVWCTSSHHTERIVDIFTLFFGGALHFKVVNWNLPTVDSRRSWEQLTLPEKRAFAEVVYRFSIDQAQRWIGRVRIDKASPVPLGADLARWAD